MTSSTLHSPNPINYKSLLPELRVRVAKELDVLQGMVFQREIDELEGLLQPYINGKAYQEVLAIEFTIQSILAQSAQERVLYFGQSGMPSIKQLRDQHERLHNSIPKSFESIKIIIDRIRGLEFRINKAIRKKSIRESKVASQVSTQNSSVTLAGGSYAKLSGYIREIENIISDFDRGFKYDKSKKGITLSRLRSIEGEVSTSEEFRELSEGSSLIGEIHRLIGVCREKFPQGGISISGLTSHPVSGQSTCAKVDKVLNNEGDTRELDQYSLEVIRYLELFSNTMRDVLADGSSLGDGRFRKFGVTPFILALKDGIQRGKIDPKNFSWQQVTKTLDVKYAYAKNMKTRLAGYGEKGDIAEKFLEFTKAIEDATTNVRINCEVLKSRMKSFFESHPFPNK